MNAPDPKYIKAIATKIAQNVTDGDDQPGDFDAVYGILCRFAVDVLNDVQGATLDALGRPRDESRDALRHLSEKVYSISKEVIDQVGR